MKNLNEINQNFSIINEINEITNIERLCEMYAYVSKQINELSYTHKRNKYFFAQMNFLHAIKNFIHIKLKQMINFNDGLPF